MLDIWSPREPAYQISDNYDLGKGQKSHYICTLELKLAGVHVGMLGYVPAFFQAVLTTLKGQKSHY